MHYLNALSQNAYTISQISTMELEILRVLGWNVLDAVHPLPFLGFLLSRAVICPGDRCRDEALRPRLVRTITKFSEYYCDGTLGRTEYLKFRRSTIAVASLVCARQIAQVEPAWSPLLQQIARVPQEELVECCRLMITQAAADQTPVRTASAQSPRSITQVRTAYLSEAASNRVHAAGGLCTSGNPKILHFTADTVQG
eukprot:Rmarinus@m.10554